MDATNPNQKPVPPPSRAGRACPRRRIESQDDVRAAITRVARKLEAGKLSPQAANALVFAFNSLSRVLADADRERRLDAIEERLANVAPRARVPVRGE